MSGGAVRKRRLGLGLLGGAIAGVLLLVLTRERWVAVCLLFGAAIALALPEDPS